ncbi:hypothetical protein ACS0TY_006704 [Phlomoides rotata]
MTSGNLDMEEFIKKFCIPSYILEQESKDQFLPFTPECPVLVFINSKSGGQLGGELLITYRSILNEKQVHSDKSFDLYNPKNMHGLYSKCGHAIYTRTLAKYEACERLLQEQMVQERALEIVRVLLATAPESYKPFGELWRDMEKLKSVRLHPSLQTANMKRLLDFVKEENLRKTVEDCSSSHGQFENKVSDFKKEFGDLKRNAEDLFSSKASFLVKDLDLAIKDHQRYINEQKSIMQALRFYGWTRKVNMQTYENAFGCKYLGI